MTLQWHNSLVAELARSWKTKPDEVPEIGVAGHPGTHGLPRREVADENRDLKPRTRLPLPSEGRTPSSPTCSDGG